MAHMRWFLHLSLLVFALSLPGAATAQIVNCNGVLTNKPCPGGTPLLDEKPYQAPSPQDLERQKKSYLIHDLEMASIQLRNEYQVNVDVSSTQQLCRISSLAECSQAVQRKLQEISERRASAINLRQQSAGTGNSDNNASAVMVFQNDYGDSDWRPPRPTWGPPPEPDTPQRKPNLPPTGPDTGFRPSHPVPLPPQRQSGLRR